MTEILDAAEDNPKDDGEVEQPKDAPIAFSKGEYVTFKEQDAEITFVHPDGLLDVQLVDKDGNAKRDEADQPYWYPRVLPENVKGR